ncbi:hypothetical protein B9G54_00745 [Alloscardovia macacae]|uniref:Uncharacterized protein n=1 Tax=Alloscardovia macacae TaxID=1160091 RepID=A0A1Y2T0Z5_9BIFI|nr:hypothetical protein [Alloscardovia macacae]OTA27633.1 hypothetical protein B9G54_00745 [Alloscardovia macacae]OTA30279.1 hypothetical protein B9T39_00825 [Alloscardovia macacae]
MAKEHSLEYAAWQQAIESQKQAEKQYKKDVKQALSKLKEEQRLYKARVDGAKNAIENAHNTWNKTIATIGELSLYNDRVEAKNSKIQFVAGEDIQIEINASGTVYTTTSTKGGKGVSLGGAVVGGVVAGPLGAVVGGSKNTVTTTNEVHDDRVIYITIRSVTNAFTVQIPANLESSARTFADAVYTTNKNYRNNLEQYQKDVQSLTARLERETADHAQVDLADKAHKDVVANTLAVDAAKRETERCHNLVPVQELEEAKKTKRRNIVIAIAAVVIVVIVLVALYMIGSSQTTASALYDYADIYVRNGAYLI